MSIRKEGGKVKFYLNLKLKKPTAVNFKQLGKFQFKKLNHSEKLAQK